MEVSVHDKQSFIKIGITSLCTFSASSHYLNFFFYAIVPDNDTNKLNDQMN